MKEDYLLHALPWVTFVVTLLLFAFICWVIYYSYLGTKMPNPTKTQSVVTMVFGIIFALVILFVFIWSILHLVRLYSKKKPHEQQADQTMVSQSTTQYYVPPDMTTTRKTTYIPATQPVNSVAYMPATVSGTEYVSAAQKADVTKEVEALSR